MRKLSLLAAVMLLAACGGSGKESVDTGGSVDLVSDERSSGELRVDERSAEDLATLDLPAPPDAVDAMDMVEDIPEPPPDVPAEVEPPPDVYADYKPQAEAAFRIDGMTMTEPAFCFMMGEACLPVLDMVNQSLNEAVADGSVSVVGLFTPFGPGETSSLTMGQAMCNLDNPILEILPVGHCMFEVDSIPAQYDDVVISTGANCGAGEATMEPPCFASGEGDMALEFYGVVLGLSNVTISGHVQDWPPEGIINPGLIRGFLPEQIAKTVEVSIPGTPPIIVTIYELLENSETQPEIIDGHNAWPVTIEFTASQMEMFD